MKQLKIKIPSGANEIIHTLQDKGYEAYLVGGCVRDCPWCGRKLGE